MLGFSKKTLKKISSESESQRILEPGLSEKKIQKKSHSQSLGPPAAQHPQQGPPTPWTTAMECVALWRWIRWMKMANVYTIYSMILWIVLSKWRLMMIDDD